MDQRTLEKIKRLSRKLAKDLDKQFGKGYAKKHPKSLGMYVAAAILSSKGIMRDIAKEQPNLSAEGQIKLITKRLRNLRRILLKMGEAILQEIQ